MAVVTVYGIFAKRHKFAALSNCAMSHTCKDSSMLNKKDKSVPLQTWIGPKGSRNLRFPDFVTTAQ